MDSRQTGMFLMGVTVGAAAALLLAPKSGPETIAFLRGKAEKGVDAVEKSVDSLKCDLEGAADTVKTKFNRGRQALKYQTENVRAAVDAGREAFREAVDSTPQV